MKSSENDRQHDEDRGDRDVAEVRRESLHAGCTSPASRSGRCVRSAGRCISEHACASALRELWQPGRQADNHADEQQDARRSGRPRHDLERRPGEKMIPIARPNTPLSVVGAASVSDMAGPLCGQEGDGQSSQFSARDHITKLLSSKFTGLSGRRLWQPDSLVRHARQAHCLRLRSCWPLPPPRHRPSPHLSPTGERALGMGGAFVAVADDATATHWNPAGLVHGGPAGMTIGWSRFQSGNQDQLVTPGPSRRGIGFTSLGSWPVGISYGHFEMTNLRPGPDPEVLKTATPGVLVRDPSDEAGRRDVPADRRRGSGGRHHPQIRPGKRRNRHIERRDCRRGFQSHRRDRRTSEGRIRLRHRSHGRHEQAPRGCGVEESAIPRVWRPVDRNDQAAAPSQTWALPSCQPMA